ncbi:MAG: Holliday junction branch migration DNA helicase RuvB [Candidatus Pacebacteria bacterium]|nr:Holliday junction branch migration DNA helicase RuvB [Candidatus Paceibacterota bacterium]
MKNLSIPQNKDSLDFNLRPNKWSDYIGQEHIKENIKIIVGAAKKRNDSACEHILLSGNSGLGKTTLAHLIANEMGKKIKVTSGTAIERPGDIAAILTNLSQGDILFIDEIHRLNRSSEEYIYPAMEDFKLDIIVGKGPMARTLELKIPPFTLIGATTKIASLSSPLRNRFGGTFRLDFYKEAEIEKIIKRSADILEMDISPEAIKSIAKRSRFTPRIANRILKRIRDFAEVKNIKKIDKGFTEEALIFMGIDNLGLESGDKKILETIIKKFNGGPVGLHALSSSSGEEEETILDIYEPYLMQLGLIDRTPRGRIATTKAYDQLRL